jgi:hypothetical protein
MEFRGVGEDFDETAGEASEKAWRFFGKGAAEHF